MEDRHALWPDGHGAMSVSGLRPFSPDGAKRYRDGVAPHFAALHPGYEGASGCLTIEYDVVLAKPSVPRRARSRWRRAGIYTLCRV